MTNAQIVQGFQKTVDQFYKYPNKKYIEETQLHFIGGLLQSALHILPNEDYFRLKQWIYKKHGYDAGGCQTGQMNIFELMADTAAAENRIKTE